MAELEMAAIAAEEASHVDPIAFVIHSLALIVGFAAAVMMVYAYKSFGNDKLAPFIRWVAIGIILLSLVHVFEEMFMFLPNGEELEEMQILGMELETFGEHFIAILGFAVIAFGAWEAYKTAMGRGE